MVVIDRKLRKWSELIERCGHEVGREHGDGVVRRASARRGQVRALLRLGTWSQGLICHAIKVYDG